MNELVILEQYNFMMGLDLSRPWTSLYMYLVFWIIGFFL